MPYVDGYVLPVPKKNLNLYRRIASKCGRIWREHGALQYFECLGDDLKPGIGMPFPQMVKPKRGEVIMFSFIVFKSRSQRDRVNAKVVNDPRLAKLCKPGAMPFDPKRMAYGGFTPVVSL